MEWNVVEIKEYRDFEDFLKSKKEHLETYAEMVGLDTKEIEKWIEKEELYSHTDSDDIEIAQIVNELHKDTLNIVEYNPERDTIIVTRITDGYIELSCNNCKRGFKIDRNYEGVVTCPYCGNLVEG